MSPEVTVLLSGHLPWWRQWQTPHYVAAHFAETARAIYVEPAVAWNRTTAAYDVRRNLKALYAPLRRVSDTLWTYTPWALPLGRLRSVARWNVRSFRHRLPAALESVVNGALVLWLSDLHTSPVISSLFPAAPKIFHALDYVTSEPDIRAAHVLARNSDLVIAATPLIAKMLVTVNERTEVLRNGWSFGKPPAATNIPAEVMAIPSPRVGMVGYLSSNLDYHLLYGLAEALPISLILVGRRIGCLSADDARFLKLLDRHPRVFFLGERPTEVLPSYISGFDVCVAPYKVNPRIYGSDPLKVYQYLALGRPTVTTPVQLLESLPPLVQLGATHDEFVTCVRKEIASPSDPQLGRLRQAFAMTTSWEARWRELDHIVRRYPRLSSLALNGCRAETPAPIQRIEH